MIWFMRHVSHKTRHNCGCRRSGAYLVPVYLQVLLPAGRRMLGVLRVNGGTDTFVINDMANN